MNNSINWDCLSSDEKIIPIQKIPNVKLLDIEDATRLLPYDQIDSFKKQSSGFEVVTFGECEEALAMAMQSRKLSKAVEKKRKEITKPALDFQKGIKKIADAFIDELKSIESSMTKKVEVFNRARVEKAEEIGVELKTVSKVEDGMTYEQEYWEFDISKIEEVPKEYFKLDDRAVRKAILDGNRSIPGLKIFKTTKKRYRIK